MLAAIPSSDSTLELFKLALAQIAQQPHSVSPKIRAFVRDVIFEAQRISKGLSDDAPQHRESIDLAYEMIIDAGLADEVNTVDPTIDLWRIPADRILSRMEHHPA